MQVTQEQLDTICIVPNCPPLPLTPEHPYALFLLLRTRFLLLLHLPWPMSAPPPDGSFPDP